MRSSENDKPENYRVIIKKFISLKKFANPKNFSDRKTFLILF